MKRLLLSQVILFVASVVSSAQQKVPVSPANCEIVYGHIELAKSRFLENPTSEDRLIILAGSPKGKGDLFDKKRIQNIIDFYVDFGGIKRNQIAWGIGQPSDTPYSYMQFFVNGNLISELTVGTRSLLCTGSGEPLPTKPKSRNSRNPS